MGSYRKIIKFKYKNNYYNMYLDNKNKHFFLKCNLDGSLSYLNIEELLEIYDVFSSTRNVMNISKDFLENKLETIPKVIIKGTATILTPALLLSACSEYKKQNNKIVTYPEPLYTQNTIDNYLSTADTTDNLLEIDTYVEIKNYSNNTLKKLLIYDSDYLDMAFGNEVISYNDLKVLIDNNPNISNNFKPLLYEYCQKITQNKDIELRIFYENLKTLKVIECDKRELVKHSLSLDSYGCYIKDENAIYVLEGYEYKKGTWEYQVIFHELSHALRCGKWNIDGIEVKATVNGLNYDSTVLAESLNSLFAISLFDYEEKDIAYQLQSNYQKVIIDCMDNYDINDYTKHSLSYYAKKLDEFTGKDNYATVIFTLMEMQYTDFHNDDIETEQDTYREIYDYISEMYFKKYINDSMSFEDALAIKDELVNELFYDVPEGYNIEYSYFDTCLENYCNSIGIDVLKNSR